MLRLSFATHSRPPPSPPFRVPSAGPDRASAHRRRLLRHAVCRAGRRSVLRGARHTPGSQWFATWPGAERAASVAVLGARNELEIWSGGSGWILGSVWVGIPPPWPPVFQFLAPVFKSLFRKGSEGSKGVSKNLGRKLEIWSGGSGWILGSVWVGIPVRHDVGVASTRVVVGALRRHGRVRESNRCLEF